LLSNCNSKREAKYIQAMEAAIKDDSEDVYEERYISIDSLYLEFPEMVSIINGIETTINKHQWKKFVKRYCEKENYKIQIPFLNDTLQYISEIFNITYPDEDNYIEAIHKLLNSNLVLKI
jgi:hypothetical protein